MALSEQEIAEIEHEASLYEQPQAAAIDALKVVQRERGWLSDEAMADVSAKLGCSMADLEGIATFYNLLFRQPVGRHVIFVCDSVSCYLVDYEKLRDALFEKLGIEFGGTTEDGRFTLLPTVCLGACDQAPAMLIDGELHGNIDPENLDSILKKYE